MNNPTKSIRTRALHTTMQELYDISKELVRGSDPLIATGHQRVRITSIAFPVPDILNRDNANDIKITFELL